MRDGQGTSASGETRLHERRAFVVLLLGSMAGAALAIPYALELQAAALSHLPMPLPGMLALQLLTNTVLSAAIIAAGLRMRRGLPYRIVSFETDISPDERRRLLHRYIERGAVAGAICFGVIVAINAIVQIWSASTMPGALPLAPPAPWKGLLASFYGGINEEVLLRLFVMTAITFVLFKIRTLRSPGKSAWVFWTAILGSSLIFGAGHLPAAIGAGATLTPFFVTRIIVLNAIGGIVFGWLYWKQSLEAAMIAHFSTDVLLHGVLPMVTRH